MSSYKQSQEEKIRKLQMQVREIDAVREENRMLIESLKKYQAEENESI